MNLSLSEGAKFAVFFRVNYIRLRSIRKLIGGKTPNFPEKLTVFICSRMLCFVVMSPCQFIWDKIRRMSFEIGYDTVKSINYTKATRLLSDRLAYVEWRLLHQIVFLWGVRTEFFKYCSISWGKKLCIKRDSSFQNSLHVSVDVWKPFYSYRRHHQIFCGAPFCYP